MTTDDREVLTMLLIPHHLVKNDGDLYCRCGHKYRLGDSIDAHRADIILAAGFARHPKPEASDEVLVEGSWFKTRELPTILGNYIRALAQSDRMAKDAALTSGSAGIRDNNEGQPTDLPHPESSQEASQ